MKKRILITLMAALSASTAFAETVVATRTIRAQTIVSFDDLKVIPETVPGMISDIANAAGFEAKSIIYAGRPIRPADIGPPALIERNQIVQLVFRAGGLVMGTEGRALDRAGVGDRVRVLNLSSRTTVYGKVDHTGMVRVGQ